MNIRSRLFKLEQLSAVGSDIAKMTDLELAQETDLLLSDDRARTANALAIPFEEVTLQQIINNGSPAEETILLINHLLYLGCLVSAFEISK